MNATTQESMTKGGERANVSLYEKRELKVQEVFLLTFKNKISLLYDKD